MLTRQNRRAAARVLLLVLLLPLTAASACEGGEDRARSANGELAKADSEPPVIPAASEAYRAVAVENGGTIAGAVTFAGTPPADTVVRPTVDQQVCGAEVRDGGVRHGGDRLADAVVWLADARTGKPLPLERRYRVTTQRCALTPRVQAGLVGGTINVGNQDRVVHRTRLVRQGPNETVAIVSEHDEGQVVPVSDALAKPGLVRITCDVHPWTRGWLAVFDHPYFAVTATDGAFVLDGVPAGEYTLVAWHPRFGRTEQRVHVSGGMQTTTSVRFGT